MSGGPGAGYAPAGLRAVVNAARRGWRRGRLPMGAPIDPPRVGSPLEPAPSPDGPTGHPATDPTLWPAEPLPLTAVARCPVPAGASGHTAPCRTAPCRTAPVTTTPVTTAPSGAEPGALPGSSPGPPRPSAGPSHSDTGLGASLFLRARPTDPALEHIRPGSRCGAPAPLLQALVVDALFGLSVALLVADGVMGAGTPRATELATFATFTGLAVLTSLFGASPVGASLAGVTGWAGGARGEDSEDTIEAGRDAYPAMTTTWTLPVALLLPPLYALLAHVPLWLAAAPRRARPARRGRTGGDGPPTHSLFHDSAALGIAGAAAAFAHRLLDPAVDPGSADRLAGSARGVTALFAAVTVYLAVDRLLRPRRWAAGRDHTATVIVQLCAALVLAVVWAASPVLLVIAVPLVLLLRRGLAHAELLSAARTDAKTRLATLGYWRQVATAETARSHGLGRPMGVLLVDIDHFKQVNDRHGHIDGDVVLLAVADALRHATRPQDLVGRFGGEEFVVLLVGVDLAAAAAIAERVRDSVAAVRVHLTRGEQRVTVSVGVASGAPASHDDHGVVTDLLERADAALYRAKREGRDRVCLAAAPVPRKPRPTA
ncbi:GGDEF domain-containing protein [Frankia sp. R43]|uniref:GGDEF domain-containing protein n=1 Tax=Frankia sp. R43 TaxID=269536 RepID=UPI001F40C40E|nr:GGDEF domain-containing protein [Frankia sp. R43]